MIKDMSIKSKLAVVALLAALLPCMYFFWPEYQIVVYYATMTAWCAAIIFFVVDILVSLIKKAFRNEGQGRTF